ncbi:PPC domain-containing DNA-binding protein [Bacillus dakarensis]|uniref:PPC domain-containing DNA-binding protein n=1 Tax=Robertmurraya dakarensis TaxID=1926278 RepID=UPI0009817592|nr:PPC domain-containing DNA-binding protein [Bacillus dakarensis]
MNDRTHSVFDKEKGILMGRVGAGEDLLTGIKNELQKHGITAGSVTCIGSLSQLSFVQFEYENKTLSYSKPIEWDTPVELLSGNGVIGVREDGELDIHFHGVFMDHKKSISGGHFLEGGNIVAITVEFTVLATSAIQTKKEFNHSLGFSFFNFYEREDG